MKFYKNISIKNRLMFVFAAWIAIFLCFSFFAINEMRRMNNVTNDIHEELVFVSSAAVEARVDIIKIGKDTKDILLLQNNEEINKQSFIVQMADRRVLFNLDVIRGQALLSENKRLEQEARDLYFQWKQSRENMIGALLAGNREEAVQLSRQNNENFALSLEEKLKSISQNSGRNVYKLTLEAGRIKESQTQTIMISILAIIIIFLFLFNLITKSIIDPMNALKDTMTGSIRRGQLVDAEAEGNNEIADISKNYNTLVKMLQDMFWIKDSLNSLSVRLSGNISLQELTKNTINFLSRLLEAGSGVFYVYDQEEEAFILNASFALPDCQQGGKKIVPGEGVVGQVALERKPILLRNIKQTELCSGTSLIHECLLNTYTFPLIFEEGVYGVIELTSFQPIDQLKQDFLEEASQIISINLYAVLQNQKVRNLLVETEAARKEIQETADELMRANELLVEQQSMLQQQAGELQQINAELEEQQQQLQQQSEELMQTNAQLEEQQQLLEEQSRMLNAQNQELESSKEELENRTMELELANKYKSQFLANMSHELRTPLNSIILLSKLLSNNEGKALNEKEIQKITVIHRSGQELLRLINDILDLSKIESGKMDLNITWFSSGDLINELRLMFEGQAREKNIRLIVEDQVNASLRGDRDKIAQVLRNLLSNAIKFTEEGNVSLRLMPDGDNGVVFNVVDTGIGIASENIPVIFEEFRQEDGSISRRFGGTGLGLSISKKLAELMGGVIEVESEVAVGSAFSVRLDNIIGQGFKGEVTSKDNYGHEEEGEAFNPKSDKAILIIEDDEEFAQYIRKINEGMGFDTLVANTGRAGLRLARKYKINGIILDMGLPDMSGIEVLRELKSTVELRGIPVHILTVGDKDNRPQRMGAIGYKTKSPDENEIVKVISKLITYSDKKPKELLIVDDNHEQVQTMRALLDIEDIVIMTADTEQQARHELVKGIYDAVVLGLDLKQGSSLDICKFIGEHGMEIPTIIYTGNELTIAQEKEIRKYADSIIVKTASSYERLLDEVTLFLHKVMKKEDCPHNVYTLKKKEHTLNLKGRKIMIVDDDPRNIFVLASALENYEAEIIEAENGAVALEKLKEEKADLVLMDIMMPVMDGYDTIRAIRSDMELKHVPIIALTAKTLKGDREKCIRAGANDYISKPVDHDMLIQLIKAWIEK